MRPTPSVHERLRQVVRAYAPSKEPAAPDAVTVGVQALLAQQDLRQIHDLPAFVHFLRDCFGPAVSSVTDHGAAAGAPDDSASRRFELLISQLGKGLPPLPVRHAIAIGTAMDGLLADRTHFDRAHWSLDVGAHAASASSTVKAGRFLYQAVRYQRVRNVLEFGTGYGISALFFLASMSDGAGPYRLQTVELSEPQFSTSTKLLAERHPDRVIVHHGRSREILPTLQGLDDLDLFFHDGGHDREQYVGDFAAVEPFLASGALVIYDDINWHDSRRPDVPMRTYEGWTEVRRHPRVARAVEVNQKYGILLLR